MAPSAFSEGIYYSNEEGANIYVDDCDAANFTVNIDGTVYGPGDVASGFSLDSDFLVSAGAGVTVGWVSLSVVQGSYGHGGARTPLEVETVGVGNVTDADSDWRELNNSADTMDFIFSPSIFYAECPGNEGRYAYIQTFPGLTLDQVGYAANLEQGVYLSDKELRDSLELVDTGYMSLTFAPASDFKNAAYSFWANYLERTFLDNQSASFYFSDEPGFTLEDLDQDVWGVWAWVVFGEEDEGEPQEFASSFYAYSNGSEFTESGIDDVFEEAVTPAPATTATTTPTLATTGANVEWLIVAGLLAGLAGSGFLALSRRKRIW
jgi:LPXTG-motif cell wall-anchored protein